MLLEGTGRVTLESSGLGTFDDVPGMDADGFREAAESAKAGCPVSKALAAVPITLTVG